jgi:catechol 2,3-dioxygenase-like lactoylglutathione lyase family enzyme
VSLPRRARDGVGSGRADRWAHDQADLSSPVDATASSSRELDRLTPSYASYATFSDGDGNGCLLQEFTERLPGRVSEPSDQGATRDSTGATDRCQRHASAKANRPTEVNMSSSDVGTASSTAMAELSTIDMGLEVVTVPVSDVDRAKRFYQSLGWRLDADFDGGDVRLVQMTPPHSQCSIHFGKGITPAEPGSLDRLMLAVKDIDAARGDLVSRGVEVSQVEEQPKPPGFPDLPGRSYFAYASFSDPDGNGWLLQEVTTRLPGRLWED